MRLGLWLLLSYVSVNLLYALKSLAGLDFLPGHHGTLFPIGDAVFERYRVHAAPLSFLGPYGNAGIHGVRGSANGRIAATWADSSGWSPVNVEYSQEQMNTSGFGVVQHVEIHPTATGATWQMLQSVRGLTEGVYELSLTLRADVPAHVGLCLQQPHAPWKFFFIEYSRVGQKWKTIRVRGAYTAPPEDDGKASFMIRSTDARSLDLSRASLECIEKFPTRHATSEQDSGGSTPVGAAIWLPR